jgi:predicted nucleic acid-binding protein
MTAVPSFPKTLLIDSGFWFALYEPRDQYHGPANERVELLHTCNLIIPWPCLYEVFNTRFAKNKAAVMGFEKLLRQPHVIRLSDDSYREAALEAAITSAQSRCFALVDMVIRMILDDINVRKHALLTFNQSDFGDLCRKHQIEML